MVITLGAGLSITCALKKTALIAAYGALLGVPVLVAQSVAADPTATNDAVPASPTRPGYHVAGLRIRPSLRVELRHDDNVYTETEETVSDWLFVFSPRVRVDTSSGVNRVQLSAGADVAAYETYDSEDFADYWLDVEARRGLDEHTQLFGGAGVKYGHEARDSQDARVGGLEPTTFRTLHADAGVRWRDGLVSYRTGGTFENLAFDDVPSRSGSVINADRDRDLWGLGLRAAYDVSPAHELFVQALVETRRYAQARDQFGFVRDSEGYRLSFGVKQGLQRDNGFEAYLGALVQDYADARFSRVERADFGGRLRVTPVDDATLTVTLQRSLNETTDAGSPGYLTTAMTAKLTRTDSARLQPYLDIDVSVSDYLETGRNDEQLSYGAGVKYFLTRNTFVSAGFSRLDRDSNDVGIAPASYDFTRNLFFINVGSQLYPFNDSITD